MIKYPEQSWECQLNNEKKYNVLTDIGLDIAFTAMGWAILDKWVNLSSWKHPLVQNEENIILHKTVIKVKQITYIKYLEYRRHGIDHLCFSFLKTSIDFFQEYWHFKNRCTERATLNSKENSPCVPSHDFCLRTSRHPVLKHPQVQNPFPCPYFLRKNTYKETWFRKLKQGKENHLFPTFVGSLSRMFEGSK